MIKVFIDTNIFLNVWNQETDPKTGVHIWEGSADVLRKIENKEILGVTSLSAIMKIAHFFKIRKKDFSLALQDINGLGIKILIPDSLIFVKAFEYQTELGLDPFDALAFSVAESSDCGFFITRDEKLIKCISKEIDALTPESFLKKSLDS